MPVITRHYSLNTKQQTTNHNFKTANSNCCPLTRAAACFDYHVQRCSLTLSSFLHLTNQHLVTFHFRFTSVILGLLLCAQILCLCTMPLRRLFALLYFHVCIHAHCPLCLISQLFLPTVANSTLFLQMLNLHVSVQSLVWNEVVLTTEVIFPIICVAYLCLQTELVKMISLHEGADAYLLLNSFSRRHQQSFNCM